jgi:hypothetical protein
MIDVSESTYIYMKHVPQGHVHGKKSTYIYDPYFFPLMISCVLHICWQDVREAYTELLGLKESMNKRVHRDAPLGSSQPMIRGYSKGAPYRVSGIWLGYAGPGYVSVQYHENLIRIKADTCIRYI